MRERVAVIDGLRTPIAKASGKLKKLQAESLGSFILSELALRVGLDYAMYDEIIIGNVSQPAHAANIARVIALKAGFSEKIPAYTVHRNCASGMQAITSSTEKILAGRGDIYLAGGVESMSNIPLLYNKKMSALFEDIFRSKSPIDKIKALAAFTPSHLKPIIGLMEGLTDPLSGLMMGSTAEILAQDFGISRKEQDEFALLSHQKAEKAQKNRIFEQEIAPIIYNPAKGLIMSEDDGIRHSQNMQALTKLKPFFDKNNGTVTAGNSSQVSDAAAAVVLMSESKAKEIGLTPLGYLKEFAYAGLEPARMGLGPAYSTAKILKMSKMKMSDFELIELNEAFASQVLANLAAFESKKYANTHLSRGAALGAIDTNILNVNGGAIALGHPVGMTGTRLVIHTLKELRRQNKNIGLATLCIGGGQGASMILEVE